MIKKTQQFYTKAINLRMEKKFFYVLFSLFAALLFIYVFLIGSITFNIVERKSMEQDALFLNSHIGELELEYLVLDKEIDLVYAKSLGFIEPEEQYFASRKTTLVSSGRITRNGI